MEEDIAEDNKDFFKAQDTHDIGNEDVDDDLDLSCSGLPSTTMFSLISAFSCF